MNTNFMATVFLISSLGVSSTFGELKVSANNLVLLSVKNDPTVSFRIWFKVGSQNDPAGKEGLASITASMLTDAATQNNTYEQVIDKLFPLAASYSASASTEMTVVYGRVHKDNLSDYYPLLVDAILRPAFKQEDLERLKSEALDYLEKRLRYSSDEELGKAVLYNNIFAGTAYGHITTGLVEALKRITLDDIKSFYRQYYTRDNVIIGLGGGYDAGLVKRLEKDMKSLPSGAPESPAKPKPRAIKGMNVTIVEKKDAASTAISMGFPISILRGSKDWYALAIANSWLGEHRNSSSHLYQVIREERGLNYGDYSYIENFPNGGQRTKPPQNVARRQQIFEMWIRPVPHEARHFALRAALREFKRLVEEGMTHDDFTLTRDFLRKYVLHYAPTTMERLGYALDDRFYGIKGSHLDNFRAMMGKITLADVNAAIRKHWQYGNMRIAFVTNNAQSLKDALINETPSPITYATTKPQSLLAEDKEISTFPLNVKAENVKIVAVEELFVR
jgi:zinc protease